MADAREVRARAGRLEIDGVPRLVMSGEIHYFRLNPAVWRERIRQARETGLDTVATYIPWIWHELPDGRVDLDGRTHPQRDLLGFLDLCAEEGMDVIARPGPFVMAELKNEGIPYRVRAEHPETHPLGWDGRPTPTRSLDYLAPAYLEAAKGWMDAVLPLLAERLASRGGPVIAVQLDNEVGMLDWVSNSPDLSELALGELAARDPEAARVARGGGAGTASELAVHRAIGLHARSRFAEYLQRLEGWARDAGIDGPLLVNVHGTGERRGRTFPVGVSQLAPAYRGRADVVAGSDFYLGDLTVQNAADLYLSNAILASVNGPEQPATSLEFEAGTGDYGEDLDHLSPPEAGALKTLLTVAQGNRAINYYLFAGGRNPEIEQPENDGTGAGRTGRIAFTGERHGFAAPIDPEGRSTPARDALEAVIGELREHEAVLAGGVEEHDELVYGFVADHYLTEYAHPDAAARREQVADLQEHRFGGAREALLRALVLGGWRFGAVDLQAAAVDDAAVASDEWARGVEVDLDPSAVVVLPTGRTLGAAVQTLLADHVLAGGRLVLAGRLPALDDDGTPCTILADALGLASAGIRRDGTTPETEYFPLVRFEGPLAGRAEVRVSSAQLLRAAGGSADGPSGGSADAPTVLARELGSGEAVAVLTRAGLGRALVIGGDLPVHLGTWRELLALLDVRPGLRIEAERAGVVATTVRAPDGSRLLVALNVAPYPLAPRLELDGRDLGTVTLPARGHALIPIP